jgi:hypothetical protein
VSEDVGPQIGAYDTTPSRGGDATLLPRFADVESMRSMEGRGTPLSAPALRTTASAISNP